MTVNIQGKDIELFYTLRMHIVYENITGESVDFMNMGSLKQATTLFLACIISSAQKKQIPFRISYDDYMNWLDENGGYNLLNEFALWLADEIKTQYSLFADEKEEETPDDLPTKKLQD